MLCVWVSERVSEWVSEWVSEKKKYSNSPVSEGKFHLQMWFIFTKYTNCCITRVDILEDILCFTYFHNKTLILKNSNYN